MSELYQLPDGWEWKTINDVCIKVTDGSHKSPKTIDVGKPYITVKDINSDGIIDFNECKFISDEDFDLLVKNNCKPNNGDILFSKDGTVGKVALVNYDIDFVVLSSLAILKPSKNILPEYLKNYLLSPYFYDNAIKSKTGAAIKRVVLKTIKELNVPLSTLSKQQRIVTKLNTLFEKIDKAIALHVKNMEEADGFMASVLNEVFSELEEKYEKITFDKVCKKITDGSHNPPQGIENSEYIMLSSKNIFNGLINFDNPRYLSEKDFNIENKRTDVNRGDVLLTIVGTIGRTAVVDFNKKFTLQRSVAVLKPNSDILNSYFLMYSLQKNLDVLVNGAQGAAQKGIYLKSLKELTIVNIPIALQEKIVTYLDDLSSKIEHVKKVQKEKMESLKALKASILDSAFRGEL